MSFPGENFLLQTDTARKLYFDHAAALPIIDYHNHLPPEDVATNRRFVNITEAWLEDDHYKWRAMRTLGVPEEFCTGTADAREKFIRWAQVVPQTLGNPLYHWTHMELQNPFGVHEALDGQSAAAIYQRLNDQLATPEFSARGLLKQRKVEVVCTTDEPWDSLRHHRDYATNAAEGLRLLPTFRLDGLLPGMDSERFKQTLQLLEQSADREVSSFEEYCELIAERHQFFHEQGCRLADAGISVFRFDKISGQQAQQLFRRVREGQTLQAGEAAGLDGRILLFIAQLNAQRGWVQQFHLGALRNANSRKVAELGQGRGFDTIGNSIDAVALAAFLDALAIRNQLASTILYNLNPADNAVFSTLAGTFNEGDVCGKVQHGAAWWFLDQKQGIEEHLQSISSLGILSCFVGMLTDSRSFLSFSRHEYFRRLLCNFLADQVAQGLAPHDIELLGGIVSAVCYENAREYFPFFEKIDGDSHVE